MATGKAAVLESYEKGLQVQDVPIPKPTNGEIVIRVLAFHLLAYTKNIVNGSQQGYSLPLPLTPGGSCVGRVHATGPDTTAFQEGQLVLCDPTIRARDDPSAQCLLGIFEGVTDGSRKLMRHVYRNGCMAQYVKMPLENVYALNEEVLLQDQGYQITDLPLLQTCMIPFGGLDDAGVKVGDTVIVAPATGKFGGAAVLMALMMGAQVVACGRNEKALERLKESMPFPSLKTLRWESDEEKDTKALMKLLKGKPADVFIDFSPPAAAAGGKSPEHIATCVNVLKRGGVVSLMGGIRGKIEIPYMQVLFKNLIVRGKFMYEKEQAQQVIKMAEKGFWKIGKVAGLKVIPFGLDQINDALDNAAQHPGWGTIVAVTP